MSTKKTPAPQRAGTEDVIPQWVVDELRSDPKLLRDVAELVRKRASRSRRRVTVRRR